MTVHSVLRCIVPVKHCEFNVNKDSVEDLNAFPYLEHLEHIAELECQMPPPPLPRTEAFPGGDAPLRDCISDPWEYYAQGFPETNLQHNLYYPLAMREEYKYIQCRIKKNGMKIYYDNVQKEEYIALRFPMFKNWDYVQKLVTSISGDLALG